MYNKLQLGVDPFTERLHDCSNGSEHPFHVHAASFMVTELDGMAVDEPYWRDTLLINVNATIHICFDLAIPGDDILAHCHAPSHMDIGMGLLLDVVESEEVPPTAEACDGDDGDCDYSTASKTAAIGRWIALGTMLLLDSIM